MVVVVGVGRWGAINSINTQLSLCECDSGGGVVMVKLKTLIVDGGCCCWNREVSGGGV